MGFVAWAGFHLPSHLQIRLALKELPPALQLSVKPSSALLQLPPQTIAPMALSLAWSWKGVKFLQLHPCRSSSGRDAVNQVSS